MTASDQPPGLGLYLLILIATVVGLMALDFALNTLVGFDLPSGATVAIPPMAAALSVGQAWAKRTGRMIEPSEAWPLSIAGGLAYGAVLAGLSGLMLASGVLGTPLPEGIVVILLGISAAVAALSILLNRWFLRTGAKGVLARR